MKRVTLKNVLMLSFCIGAMFFTTQAIGQTVSIDNATNQVQTAAGSMKVMFKWIAFIILGAGFLYAIYAYTIDSSQTRRANVGLIGAIIIFTIAALMGLISN